MRAKASERAFGALSHNAAERCAVASSEWGHHGVDQPAAAGAGLTGAPSDWIAAGGAGGHVGAASTMGSGTLMLRERSHSPSALACASSRSARGGAGPEQSSEHEVDGAEVGELVARDRELACFGKQASELVDGEGRREPVPCGPVAYPDTEVRVAAFVAGAGMHELTERDDDQLVAPRCRRRRRPATVRRAAPPHSRRRVPWRGQ